MKKQLLIIDNARLVKNTDDQELIRKVLELIEGKPPIEEDGQPTFQWPTEFLGVVTQAFGMNAKLYSGRGVPAHEGLDIKASLGSKIYAAWGGVVSREDLWHNAYGYHIRLRSHINGIEYEHSYAHFMKSSPFNVGDEVKKGDVLGLAGSTGWSSGPHLHFMLKQFNGDKPDTEKQKEFDWPYDLIDPTPFFAELR